MKEKQCQIALLQVLPGIVRDFAALPLVWRSSDRLMEEIRQNTVPDGIFSISRSATSENSENSRTIDFSSRAFPG